MRHLLLALLIALLPIRGWVGDAMALSMLAAPAQAMAHGAAAPSATPPCHEETTAQAAEVVVHQSDGSGSTHAHCGCDVCNGPSLSLAAPAVPPSGPLHSLLVPPLERFANTEPRQGHKPPIS